MSKIQTGGSPCGVGEAGGAAWVSDAADGRLLRIDLATHVVTTTATLDPTPCEMTFAFGALWVGDDTSDARDDHRAHGREPGQPGPAQRSGVGPGRRRGTVVGIRGDNVQLTVKATDLGPAVVAPVGGQVWAITPPPLRA